MSHDPRCERSAAKRCRCDCDGRLHGAALEAVRLAMEHQHNLDQIEAAGVTIQAVKAAYARVFGRAT